jgi:hypothetical protein
MSFRVKGAKKTFSFAKSIYDKKFLNQNCPSYFCLPTYHRCSTGNKCGDLTGEAKFSERASSKKEYEHSEQI